MWNHLLCFELNPGWCTFWKLAHKALKTWSWNLAFTSQHSVLWELVISNASLLRGKGIQALIYNVISANNLLVVSLWLFTGKLNNKDYFFISLVNGRDALNCKWAQGKWVRHGFEWVWLEKHCDFKKTGREYLQTVVLLRDSHFAMVTICPSDPRHEKWWTSNRVIHRHGSLMHARS